MGSSVRYGDSHEIHSPRSFESCYVFTVEHLRSGRKSRAVLTRELYPDTSFDRTLLLCPDPSVLLSGDERRAYGALAELLESSAGRRVVQAKTLVNAIVDGDLNPDRVRVAVHSFGPVPVCVGDLEVKISVHGREVSARLAVFPGSSRSRPGWRDYAPTFVNTHTEFRRCLEVAPQRVFQRYMEDVAEDFHDLRRTLGHARPLARAKRIERSLAASVKGKLDILVPRSSLEKQRDPVQRETWAYFVDHASVLYEYSLARLWALLTLNQIYECVGVHAKAYLPKVNACHERFSRLLGPRKAAAVRNDSEILQFITSCLERQTEHSLLRDRFANAQELLSMARDAPGGWCSELAKAAAFGLMLAELTDGKPATRLFVSHHFEVPPSKVVRDQLANHLSEEFSSQIQALSVLDLPPGAPHRHIIRAAIWLAQGTIAICPKDTASIVTAARDKDYKWIAREAEYTLLLGKPVLFGVEKNANRENIAADFSNPDIGYLVAGSKLPPDGSRASRLKSQLVDHVHSDFTITRDVPRAAYLDPGLRDEATTFAKGAHVQGLRDVLEGYLGHLEPDTHRTLVFVLQELGPLGRKPRAWIIAKVARHLRGGNHRAAERAFDRMYRQVKRRKLHLGGRGIALLEHDGKRYAERLTLILRWLRPSLSMSERKQWRRAWLDNARHAGRG